MNKFTTNGCKPTCKSSNKYDYKIKLKAYLATLTEEEIGIYKGWPWLTYREHHKIRRLETI